MQRFDAQRIGIAQGSELLFSDFQTGGEMWTGSGPRERRRRVRFDQPFAAPPAVMVALDMWDIANDANQRIDIHAEEITPEGFEIVLRTWGDTRIARARAAWTAIGPVSDEDLWDV